MGILGIEDNMILTENIKDKIQKLYEETPDYVHGVSFGIKRTNDSRTGESAIVFYVDQKKPISSLDAYEIIPSEIKIDGKLYKTDVVQMPRAQAYSCYLNESETPDQSYFSANTNVTRLRAFDTNILKPMRGGQLICQYPTEWFCAGGNCSLPPIGTLGGFCVDNIDGKVVGVTNAHVLLYNLLYASESNIAEQNATPYNIYENLAWQVDSQNYRPGVLGFNNLSAATNIYTRLPLIGQMKRHIPIRDTGTNYVDVSLFHPNPSMISNDSAFKVWQPIGMAEYTMPYPFASTAEIDALLSSDPKLYSTGITTGPKGYSNISCTTTSTSTSTSTSSTTSTTTSTTCSPATTCCLLRVVSPSYSVSVNYGTFVADFSDVIVYEYEDNSLSRCPSWPSAPGDSGSFVIADFGGSNRKIIGICFAGNGYYSFACRIDRVVSAINIRAWDGTYNLNSLPVTTSNLITTSYSGPYASQPTLSYGGRVYYQAGFTKTAGLPLIV
jgi:hypothetical protein